MEDFQVPNVSFKVFLECLKVFILEVIHLLSQVDF